MQSAELSSENGRRTYALVFKTGEDPLAGILDFARGHQLTASRFTAVGAFERAVLGFFDLDEKDYRRIPVEEQVEVVSLAGNITRGADSGAPMLHIHCVLGRSDGRAVAGHLLEARVRPTLEVVLVEEPARLARRHDARTGLALLDLSAGTGGGEGTADRATAGGLRAGGQTAGGGKAEVDAAAETWWPGPGQGGGQP